MRVLNIICKSEAALKDFIDAMKNKIGESGLN